MKVQCPNCKAISNARDEWSGKRGKTSAAIAKLPDLSASGDEERKEVAG